MSTVLRENRAAPLWNYNAALLEQAIAMIERLEHMKPQQSESGFEYASAVGPHMRHIIEHYQALLNALDEAALCVDYDARRRNTSMQTDPSNTLAAVRRVIAQLRVHASAPQHVGAAQLAREITTRMQAGLQGEFETTVPTTLGRELLFLASHTVHHFALVRHHCRTAGVDLGDDFGKAPATLAFEQARAAQSA